MKGKFMAKAIELFRKGKEIQRKNWLMAYQYFSEITKIEPDFMPAYHELADMLHKRGFIKEAFGVLNVALRIKPEDPLSLFAMANLCLATGKPGPALRYYRKTYEKMEDPPADIHFLMALCHGLLGHYKKALVLAKRAISLDQYLLEAYDLYGRLCIETEAYEEAESAYRHILQYDNEDPNARYMLGVIYAKQSRWEEAIEEWERVIEISLEMDDAIRELGWAWNMLGNTERSILLLRKALELNPNNLQARIDLSAVLIGKRYFSEAIKELEIARRLDPQNDLIERLLSEIKGGLID